jgi:hypothetical protein
MGDKTNWSGMFHSMGHNILTSQMRNVEGGLLNKLGVGNADGKSKNTAWWVRLADGATGGALSGDSLGGGLGGGLLGMLNDSNFFSGLFGGRLFGAGGFFGPHAMGGPALAGVPIPVGELGPEMFVPSVPGNIIPTNRLGGGSVTIGHIDARGTDPALTQIAVMRAMSQTHAQAVRDASKGIADRNRRVPH